MRFVSLFSGCDGLGLGLERAGMTCVAHSEINKHACKVLAKHWPNVPNLGDISDIDTGDLPDAELFCGGFPCTNVSLAGDRKGLAGEYSGLWFQFARILGEVRPPWCLIENVDALLSSNGGRDLGTILGTLGKLGYGFAFRVLDSRWAGLAQRRKRLFIVGSLGTVRAAEVLLEPDRSLRGSPPCRPQRETSPVHSAGSTRRHLGRIGAFSPGAGTSAGTIGWEEDVSPTLKASGGGNRVPIVMRWREGKPGGGKGGLFSEDQSLTLATSNDQYLFFDGVRRFTPRETERLQGLPDDWTRWGPGNEEIADTHRYAMTGNAVSVPVAEFIGRRIMSVDPYAGSSQRGSR